MVGLTASQEVGEEAQFPSETSPGLTLSPPLQLEGQEMALPMAEAGLTRGDDSVLSVVRISFCWRPPGEKVLKQETGLFSP